MKNTITLSIKRSDYEALKRGEIPHLDKRVDGSTLIRFKNEEGKIKPYTLKTAEGERRYQGIILPSIGEQNDFMPSRASYARALATLKLVENEKGAGFIGEGYDYRARAGRTLQGVENFEEAFERGEIKKISYSLYILCDTAETAHRFNTFLKGLPRESSSEMTIARDILQEVEALSLKIIARIDEQGVKPLWLETPKGTLSVSIYSEETEEF